MKENPLLHIALYEPEIPQNLGSILRLGACLEVMVHIIEPCGFPLSDKRLRRSGMDYMDHVSYERHESFQSFREKKKDSRVLLFDTRGQKSFDTFAYKRGDIFLFGKESTGVPEDIFETVDETLLIPMKQGMRSINVAMSAAMGSAIALHKICGFPR